MRSLKPLLFLIVWAPAIAVAGPFEDGAAAYEKGDYTTTLRLWRLLAEQGNPAAQLNLGVMYGKGQGAPQDHATAMSWFRRAAEQDLAEAQYNLGVMYGEGRGVTRCEIALSDDCARADETDSRDHPRQDICVVGNTGPDHGYRGLNQSAASV